MSQTAAAPRATGTIASHKIQPRHLERSAVVYVRQSTVQQIVRHQESTKIQYGLAGLAERLGWLREQVVVIDEDLGVSGASSEGRAGFQKLLADVALDRVGLILGVEMSRLARSCKDWYQLLELCAVYGTLIGDLDGLYDPAQYNDRLLLGLKGTMSEAELHVLRQRLQQGQLAKARRGELGRPVPIGYVRRPSGEVVLDPDEEARATVRLIFEQFDRIGTVGGVLKYLATQGIKLGVRVHSGPAKGELDWRRPNRQTLQQMIHNPAYAGVYAYGRRATDPRRQRPGHRGTGRIVVPREQWVACLKDRQPAYIPWEQYERNVARLAEHRSHVAVRGAVRRGAALVQGLVVCGRCGARMATQYRSKGAHVRYQCLKQRADYGGRPCQGLTARALDAEVSRLALQALAPAALEVSLKVGEDVERTRAELETRWKRRLERAKYESDRAARQYRAVEPENRLVARTLEAAWEEKLREQRKLEEEHERSCRELPRVLTEEERQAIRALAADLPALWSARTTTVEDRKAILRQVVDRVVPERLRRSLRAPSRPEGRGARVATDREAAQRRGLEASAPRGPPHAPRRVAAPRAHRRHARPPARRPQRARHRRVVGVGTRARGRLHRGRDPQADPTGRHRLPPARRPARPTGRPRHARRHRQAPRRPRRARPGRVVGARPGARSRVHGARDLQADRPRPGPRAPSGRPAGQAGSLRHRG